RDFSGSPLFTGTDTTLNSDWKEGAPRGDMDPDNFGVRWTGIVRPAVSGTYRIGLIGTVKFQLWLDGRLVARSVYPTHDGEFPDPWLSWRRSNADRPARTAGAIARADHCARQANGARPDDRERRRRQLGPVARTGDSGSVVSRSSRGKRDR